MSPYGLDLGNLNIKETINTINKFEDTCKNGPKISKIFALIHLSGRDLSNNTEVMLKLVF